MKEIYLTLWKNNRIDQEIKINVNSLIKEYFKSEVSKIKHYLFDRKFITFLTQSNYTCGRITDKEWDALYEAKENYEL